MSAARKSTLVIRLSAVHVVITEALAKIMQSACTIRSALVLVL